MTDSFMVGVIDEAYLMQVFRTLATMDVDLDGDPLRYGPKRLNGKVASCRRHLNRCQQIYLQLSSDLQRLNREHRKAKLDYDMAFQDLMSNDPDVRAGRSVRDREAVASTKLRTEQEAISDMEAAQTDMEAALSVVRAKRDDLKDVQGRIRDQIKLCQEEINLGGNWGSAPPPENPQGVDIDTHPQVNLKALEVASSIYGSDAAPLEINDLDAFVESMTSVSDSMTSTQLDESGDLDDFLSDRVVQNQSAPAINTAVSSQIDDFFNTVDVTPPAKESVIASDIDLDDLLFGLGG